MLNGNLLRVTNKPFMLSVMAPAGPLITKTAKLRILGKLHLAFTLFEVGTNMISYINTR